MKQHTSRTLLGLAAAGAAAALLAACSSPPPAASDDAAAAQPDFLACMVSDFGGFDDRGFNQAVIAGLDTAEEEYGIETMRLESTSENDYAPNLEQAMDQGCDFTVTVGFSLAEATKAAAEGNPDSEFAIIDDASIDLPNVKPVVFDTAQASFLAGYLAAGYSKTGTVATFGGQPFPPVLLFMDGFSDGVAYYNEQHDAAVKLLGWDKATQEGTFSGTFTDISAGKTLTQTFIDQGADVVMPVAGSLYLGSAEAAREAPGEVAMIGVDNDAVVISPDISPVVLTSVMKQMADAVVELIGQAVDGEFDDAPFVGDLANEGVAIAPLHEFEDAVSPELVAEVEAIREQIIAGDLVVESANTPK